MVKKSSDVVKAVVHKPAAKSTFGTDPKDPWSTKAGIDENVTSRRADLLSKFYKSRGWNVNYISKNKKVAQSKTGDYEKWKRDHGIYESEICSQCQVDPCICDDSHGFVDKMDESYYNNRTGFTKRKREDDEYHNGPDPVKHTYNYTVSKDGGEKHQRTVTTPPTRSAKHEVEHMARNHLEKQGYTIHEESMVEMDKSQTPPGRDGSGTNSDAGKKEYIAKMVTPKEVTKKAAAILNKSFKNVKEDNMADPQCACQSPFDGANTTDDVAPKKSKAAKMVKEIYSKHRLAEDLYDWEKSDKQGEQYGKAPKVKKTDGVNQLGDKKANAGMILKGGTTLTGQPRDTVEIDPMLKNRTSMPDYKSMDTKKRTKPQ